MNQGDSIPIVINYTVDGSSIQQGAYDDIMLDIECFRFKRSSGDMTWDSTQQKYVVTIPPYVSESLPPFVRYQLTIVSDGKPFSSEWGTFGLGRKLNEHQW